MPSIEAVDLAFVLPGGRTLFKDVSFRVGDRQHVALVGANGSGKTTLLRLIAGLEAPHSGHFSMEGRLGFMRQFVASAHGGRSIRDFLVELARPSVRAAAHGLARAAAWARDHPDTAAQLAYADALAAWDQAGGYAAEIFWDASLTTALGKTLDQVGHRPLSTLSGGEQKRLALETLLRSDDGILLLDEPDNFLDIPGKRWLEEQMNESKKTILYVSHDRALLANTSDRVVTIEGNGAWTHGESFATYEEARERRLAQIDDERRRYRDEHARLVAMMREFKRRAAINPKFASRARATETRIERFESDSAPRERPLEQKIKMHLGGGRTGRITLRIQGLALPGLVEAFDTEIHLGERIGVVGANGTGKTHFLRLLNGEAVKHEGRWALGARVEPGLFSQLHDRSDLEGKSILEVIMKQGLDRTAAMSRLKRYELTRSAHDPFSLLSGGQQARYQILMMEVAAPTMLLLDEPTDNLDIESAEALEEALLRYEGTVIAVTHDRWFMYLMDRFLVFDRDGSVTERLESPYA